MLVFSYDATSIVIYAVLGWVERERVSCVCVTQNYKVFVLVFSKLYWYGSVCYSFRVVLVYLVLRKNFQVVLGWVEVRR